LTEKGHKLAEEIPVEPIAIFRSALEGLTRDEVRDTLKIVHKITARFKAIVKRDLGEAQ